MDKPALAQPAALLEREPEVERIRATLQAAGRQTGGTLVIEGAAGIGKSRLLDEVRAAAPDLVRQLFERPVLEADAAERDRWLSGAATLAAEVLMGAPPSASRAPPPGASASDPSYALQHGLYWLASNLSTDSPLALVVDDLQWCDAPSVRTLAFIARRLEGQPLALVLATRPLPP